MAIEDGAALTAHLVKAEESLARYLDNIGHPGRSLSNLVAALRKPKSGMTRHADPVRTKNLQKCADYIHRLIELEPTAGAADGPLTSGLATSLGLYLRHLEEPAALSADSAWELADALYGVLISVGTAMFVGAELRANRRSFETGVELPATFTADEMGSLIEHCEAPDGDANSIARARQALLALHNAKVDEYRRDRAKIRLRAKSLGRMAGILAGVLAALCVAYMGTQGSPRAPGGPVVDTHPGNLPDPSFELLLVVLLAGAGGSILSRAIKLGKQPLHASGPTKVGEPPLGIRELMSGWSVFVAQPIIGAAAAFVVYLIFMSGLIRIPGLASAVEAWATLSFLAGFSEPFFFGILDKVSGEAPKAFTDKQSTS